MALPLVEFTFQTRPPVIGQLQWSGYHHDAPPRTRPLHRVGLQLRKAKHRAGAKNKLPGSPRVPGTVLKNAFLSTARTRVLMWDVGRVMWTVGRGTLTPTLKTTHDHHWGCTGVVVATGGHLNLSMKAPATDCILRALSTYLIRCKTEGTSVALVKLDRVVSRGPAHT